MISASNKCIKPYCSTYRSKSEPSAAELSLTKFWFSSLIPPSVLRPFKAGARSDSSFVYLLILAAFVSLFELASCLASCSGPWALWEPRGWTFFGACSLSSLGSDTSPSSSWSFSSFNIGFSARDAHSSGPRERGQAAR
jgi:hypothetical protein